MLCRDIEVRMRTLMSIFEKSQGGCVPIFQCRCRLKLFLFLGLVLGYNSGLGLCLSLYILDLSVVSLKLLVPFP